MCHLAAVFKFPAIVRTEMLVNGCSSGHTQIAVSNVHHSNSFPIFTSKTKLLFPNLTLTLPHTTNQIGISYSLKRDRHVLALNEDTHNPGGCFEERYEAFHVFKRWIELVRDVLPGGSWWNLCVLNSEIGRPPVGAKPVTVLIALREMWDLIAGEKWILFIAFCATTVAALSEIAMPGIITSCIFSAQNGAAVGLYQKIQLLLFLCIISGICSGMRSGCFAIANTILVKRLTKTMYRSLLLQDISFFDRETVGDLTSRIGTDCQRLSRTIGHDMHLILRNILQGTGAFINLMCLSWPLALCSLVICFVLSTIFFFYGMYQKKAAKLAQDFAASANEVAEETLSLIKTVRTSGTEVQESQRYVQGLEKLAVVGLRESVAYGFWNLSFIILYRMTQVFAIILGGASIISGHVSAEQLTKYVLYCEWLIYAAWRLQDNMSSLLQSVGACDKVFQLMHLTPSHQFLSRGIKLPKLDGCIDFVNVWFHYSSRNMVPILKNVNISIPANEIVAVVGVSGSGKSTLINLLLRLYEPTSGEIFVNGIHLLDIDIQWLREKIGFVGQEPHMFHMDVKSNISYGSRNVTFEDVETAAKITNVHGFITALPNGYETIVDDNLLSGGQKQRIAIARAIVRDPTILILDEATSALDSDNEGYIKEIIHGLKNDPKKERTIIIIAHRLSTIKEADRVLVMNDGQIVEIGNHRELLVKNGPYARLFKIQSDGFVD